MKRRITLLLLAVCLLTGLLPVAVLAEETRATEETVEATEPATSGTCGENVSWELEGNTLIISGSGDMTAGSPWAVHKDKIEKVIFTGSVTEVGAEAFADHDAITEVDFGSAMKEIDTHAFLSCDGLTSISLPETFRRFGAECFRDCSELTEVHCTGGMPSFNSGCLWNGGEITVYTQPSRPWPQEYVEELERNFGGRLKVEVEAAKEAPVQIQPTQAPTEPATEPPAETEPATEPVTEPVTIPTTIPITEPAVQTESATEPAAVETAERTQPTEETSPETMVEKVGGDGWKGLVIVAAVFTLIAAGVLIFRIASNKEGRYVE